MIWGFLSKLLPCKPVPQDAGWVRLAWFWLMRKVLSPLLGASSVELDYFWRKKATELWQGQRKERTQSVLWQWIGQCLPEKRGDFGGNAGTEEGTVPARVEEKEWLVEDERDLPPWILGWKIGLCVRVCLCVCVCMFKRGRGSECQIEEAWVCWDKHGSLWGCCFPGTLCVCACVRAPV